MAPSTMLRDERYEDEKRGFLGDELEQFSQDDGARLGRASKSSRYWNGLLIFQSIIIGALSLVLLKKTFQPGASLVANPSDGLYSPLTPYIKYKVDQPPVNYWDNMLYVKPSYESDYAWNDILDNQTVRVHDEDVKNLNMTHLPLLKVQGGGYATIMGVFHNLHCLRRLRQSMFFDYYSANKTEAELEADAEHTYHCLEVLRTSMMCHADLSLYPMTGGGGPHHPLLANANVPRQCVDWDLLMKGIESSHFTQFEIMTTAFDH